MKVIFYPLAIAALAGCAMLPGAKVDNARVTPSLQQPAPPEAAPAAPTTQSAFSPDVPYYNLGTMPVPVFADSGLKTRSGALALGAGGFVETCLDNAPICRIKHGADERTDWVDLTKLGAVAN